MIELISNRHGLSRLLPRGLLNKTSHITRGGPTLTTDRIQSWLLRAHPMAVIKLKCIRDAYKRGKVFFSTPMKRYTTLATQVQRTSSFTPIKTVWGLHRAVNEKSRRRYTQQATNKHSTKSSCCVLHKHLPRYKLKHQRS